VTSGSIGALAGVKYLSFLRRVPPIRIECAIDCRCSGTLEDMVIAVAVVVHVQRIRQVWNWVIVWSARRVDKTPHVARQLESLETVDVILVESTRIWCSRKEPFQLSPIVSDLLGDNVTS